MEMYRTPSSRASGMRSTNSGMIVSCFVLSRLVVHDDVRIDPVDYMMLFLQIKVYSSKLLPLDNGEDCIQGVQLSYLYVARILIIFVPYCIGHPIFHSFFDSRQACSRSHQTAYHAGI